MNASTDCSSLDRKESNLLKARESEIRTVLRHVQKSSYNNHLNSVSIGIYQTLKLMLFTDIFKISFNKILDK